MTIKRPDKRKIDELRPIEAKAGVIKRADGSGWFKIGNTVAYAAVYGPKATHLRFLKSPDKGNLRCHYNMMPFSGAGDRVRPGGSRRSKEISKVMEDALSPVLNLDNFPNSIVEVYVELSQTDAGTRCAGICAASIALADAGIPMKDLVCAVAVGSIKGEVVIDLSKEEEDIGDAVDIPIAVIPSTGKITLLQMDGILKREDLKKALELGKAASSKIYEVQKKALKDKFKGGESK